jgi:hypothetical protein
MFAWRTSSTCSNSNPPTRFASPPAADGRVWLGSAPLDRSRSRWRSRWYCTRGPTGVPEFPSLVDKPDPALQGTVAYLADASGCVRVVAVAGRPSRDVLCLPAQDPEQAKRLGKLVGPQLVWRSDGRLEVTMFRLTDPPGPSLGAGWQKIVDVRTGSVEDVPAADVPSRPNLGTEPTVSPDGRRVTHTSDDGRITVVLHDATGSRTRCPPASRSPTAAGFHLDERARSSNDAPTGSDLGKLSRCWMAGFGIYDTLTRNQVIYD